MTKKLKAYNELSLARQIDEKLTNLITDVDLLKLKCNPIFDYKYQSIVNAELFSTGNLGTNCISGNVNSGSLIAVNSVTNHQGIVALRNSTTTLSGAWVGTLNTSFLLRPNTYFDTSIRLVSSSTSTLSRVGLHSSISATDPINGAWFRITYNGTNAVITPRVRVDTGTIVDGTDVTVALNTWVRLSIVVNSASIIFNIYNEAGTLLNTQTISTSLPLDRLVGALCASFSTAASPTQEEITHVDKITCYCTDPLTR